MFDYRNLYNNLKQYNITKKMLNKYINSNYCYILYDNVISTLHKKYLKCKYKHYDKFIKYDNINIDKFTKNYEEVVEDVLLN